MSSHVSVFAIKDHISQAAARVLLPTPLSPPPHRRCPASPPPRSHFSSVAALSVLY